MIILRKCSSKVLIVLMLLIVCNIVSYAQSTSHNKKPTTRWTETNEKTKAWVTCESRPNKIKYGLDNRHIALWASHGRYYDLKKEQWRWQRPNLFCTTEDLYTQTIVVPFLMPMLQNAGAVVVSPRERDWQTNEIIIDNDNHSAPYYREIITNNAWETCPSRGFSHLHQTYTDGENPFNDGTTRMARTTKSKDISAVIYQPYIPEAGKYAVYVSYQTTKNSIDDAEYVVNHKGQTTIFRVNQQMGGGTWVYLGTFDFDKGCSINGSVMLTNNSKKNGVVTTDAVRFGGGMGNIERAGTTSGLPRALEAARYFCQWAGMPYSVYSSKNGKDDYSDDINTRSLYINHLAGGSPYVPNKSGLNVPIELSLAVHSDAGYKLDGSSLVGTLAICTTNHNDGQLNSGLSRQTSKSFADLLLNTITDDLQRLYGRWTKRAVWDKNYSETRLPEMPSAIIETLSHQNFPDMRFGQDPSFRFHYARALYKSILKFTSELHRTKYVVAPLPPDHFRIEQGSSNKIVLRWKGVTDRLESTAKPKAYKVYTAIDNSDFDNGTIVKGQSYKVKTQPGKTYSFRVTAINDGGESFPTQVLSASIVHKSARRCLVVDGFQRIASPQVIDYNGMQGFDILSDPGVSFGKTLGWSGAQQQFDKTMMGDESANGLGYSGNEMIGQVIAGNDFNYVATHAKAIADAKIYNVVSCSREALEQGFVNLNDYDCVDILFGLQRNDGYSLRPYKTFTAQLTTKITQYLQHGGRLLTSGAYLASDMQTTQEQDFLQRWLKSTWGGANRSDSKGTILGMNTSMDIYSELNAQHYAATTTDILHPASDAICAMQYADGSSAATAYSSRAYRTFTMGFPFECIRDEAKRAWVMRAILSYLLEN